MIINLAAVVRIVPLTALMLGACVSQSAYDQLQAQNQQLLAQLTQSRAEQKFTEAGDMLFPEGGFQLSQAGQAELANNIAPKLRGLQNSKVVVYGYTDSTPVGAALQKQGIPDNLVLSTRRAAAVVTFLVSQGVNPNIISAKGFGDTHPEASNDTPQGRRRTAASKSPSRGPAPQRPDFATVKRQSNA
jgi:chemotaxis protein MotB